MEWTHILLSMKNTQDFQFPICNTYIGLLLSMTRYSVRVGILGTYLNTFLRLIAHRMRVYNTVLFIAPESNADAHAVCFVNFLINTLSLDSPILEYCCFPMQVNITYGVMMSRLVVFCVIVTQILQAGYPRNLKVFLILLIVQPIKIHFHGFGEFLDNGSDDYYF